jgi:hypothetical protein
MFMDPSASKTRRIALSLVLSAANVVVVVFDRSQHRRPDSVPLVLALIAFAVVTLGQVWRNAVA